MPSLHSRLPIARFLRGLVLLAALLPALAQAQAIAPGKYRHEEFRNVQRAAFNADGRGLVLTETRDGRIPVVARFVWSVEDGKLVQRNIEFTRDHRTWMPAPDTAIEIRNITPKSFELNRMDGWQRWTLEE